MIFKQPKDELETTEEFQIRQKKELDKVVKEIDSLNNLFIANSGINLEFTLNYNADKKAFALILTDLEYKNGPWLKINERRSGILGIRFFDTVVKGKKQALGDYPSCYVVPASIPEAKKIRECLGKLNFRFEELPSQLKISCIIAVNWKPSEDWKSSAGGNYSKIYDLEIVGVIIEPSGAKDSN